MVIPHPVLQSNGRKDTAIAVADPTVTFLESGPNVGVLLSSHTVPTKEGYSLHEVTWIRCVPKAGLVSRIFNRHVMQQREFKGVLLERHVSSDVKECRNEVLLIFFNEDLNDQRKVCHDMVR